MPFGAQVSEELLQLLESILDGIRVCLRAVLHEIPQALEAVRTLRTVRAAQTERQTPREIKYRRPGPDQLVHKIGERGAKVLTGDFLRLRAESETRRT
jgi:hypothetical protein